MRKNLVRLLSGVLVGGLLGGVTLSCSSQSGSTSHPPSRSSKADAVGPISQAKVDLTAQSSITMKYHSEASQARAYPLKKASLSEVFTKANRKATYGRDCMTGNLRLKATPKVRWCFQSGDNSVGRWIPQGVSTDSDAVSDESWNGHKGILVSRYSTKGQGVRLSLLNTKTKRYRHLLLVVPSPDPLTRRLSYAPLKLHAGGIVWYGERLYVADTYNGVRVFDLKNIYDLTASPNGDTKSKQIGRVFGTFYGGGYRYVIPQTGYWRSPLSAGSGCSSKADVPIHNSWLSLDRSYTPDRLLIGEYCQKRHRKHGKWVGDTTPGRVTMWKMRNHEIAASGRVATATRVLTLPALNGSKSGANIQGGATIDAGKTWFFDVSHGDNAAGTLWRFGLGGHWNKRGTKTTPQGPEDLSYRYRHSKRLLYSVTEHAHRRIVYARNTYSGWQYAT